MTPEQLEHRLKELAEMKKITEERIRRATQEYHIVCGHEMEIILWLKRHKENKT